MESRYGVNQVCSVGTYTTLQVKAAIKDLCRLKGVPVPEVNMFTNKLMDVSNPTDLFKVACQKKDVAAFLNRYPDVIQTMMLIFGQPKAKSIHACAMMIYPDEKDMFHWNPIRRQDDMMISEWEGGELDAAGFLKEDILGILQLSKFEDILRLIKEHTGKEVDIYSLPLDDRTVYTYFQKGWTGDVFHFGAKGLTGYCKLLKPDDITELVNCIGLYRPGVMEGNFHNEYILRKQGVREVGCRKGSDAILRDTRYIMIWQEQTMKMFRELGGFDLVEADSARRALGKKDATKLLPYKERFLEHYMTNFGVDRKYAEDTWQEIENMAAYQFNHCVSGDTEILTSLGEKITVRDLVNNHARNGCYGYGLSLNEYDRLVLNEIKDIRFAGNRLTYIVELRGGANMRVTDNHKFPTGRGELMLKDMAVGDTIPFMVDREKGLVVYEEIIDIRPYRIEDVYDVEMADPYHTFTTGNGIVTCNSHAAAYANTGYACEWLKVNYPLEFWSVAFSYADDDDYPVYLHEINEIGGIKVMPPDINESTDRIKTDFDENALYWSISSVKQVGDKAQEELMAERGKNGPYFSFSEFLDRHSFKGSKVNKSVVENLILCGAFDKLENITRPSRRIELINRYRDEAGVKVDPSKDLFATNPSKTSLDWWYALQQKRLCGLAFFDYRNLYETYFKEMVDSPMFPYRDFSEIPDDPMMVKSERLSTGGYVYEISVKAGKKGEWAIVTLEQNYQFKTVIFWAEEYEEHSELLQGCKGTIMFVNGGTNFDERNQQTVIYPSSESMVLILT